MLFPPELPRRLKVLLPPLMDERLLKELRREGLATVAAVAVALIPTRCVQSASATTLHVLTTAALTLSSSHVTCKLNGAINSARDCKDVRRITHYHAKT